MIKELQVAEEMTKDNDVLTLTMCVNYGGRSELGDAARALAKDVAAGRLNPDKVNDATLGRYLYVPELPEADLIWRTSGEQRLSNFMLYQAAYAELVFSDVLWPDVDRRHLWQAVDEYARATGGTAEPTPDSRNLLPTRPGSPYASRHEVLPPRQSGGDRTVRLPLARCLWRRR